MPDIDDPFDRQTLPCSASTGCRTTSRGRAASRAPVPTGAGETFTAGPRPAGYAEPVGSSAQQWLGLGLSPLVRAASPLLLLAGQLRGTLSVPDVAGLRRHALEEIRRFEERARAAAVSSEIVTAARYVLCAGLDEAVLSTPWGAQSEWAQQTFSLPCTERRGVARSFRNARSPVERSRPSRRVDGVAVLCLAFGFGANTRSPIVAIHVCSRCSTTCIKRSGRSAVCPRWTCPSGGVVSRTGGIH